MKTYKIRMLDELHAAPFNHFDFLGFLGEIFELHDVLNTFLISFLEIDYIAGSFFFEF